jgi:copper chaperone CopZ
MNAAKGKNFVKNFVGPRNSISGIDDEDFFVSFDPIKKDFIFRGQSVNIQEIVSAIERILADAKAMAKDF